jgi:phage terminase small subunit
MGKLEDLDPKRRRFVEEYAVDWNATQAAIRAGYSAKTAQQQGSRLLLNVVVQAALGEIMQERAERCKITVDDAIAELTKLGFANMLDYMRIGEDGDPFVDLSALTKAKAAGLIEFTCEDFKDGRGEDARDVRRVKIKMTDKVRPLTEIIKHLKGDTGKVGDDGILAEAAQIVADEKLRVERMEEIAARYLPRTKKKQAE